MPNKKRCPQHTEVAAFILLLPPAAPSLPDSMLGSCLRLTRASALPPPLGRGPRLRPALPAALSTAGTRRPAPRETTVTARLGRAARAAGRTVTVSHSPPASKAASNAPGERSSPGRRAGNAPGGRSSPGPGPHASSPSSCPRQTTNRRHHSSRCSLPTVPSSALRGLAAVSPPGLSAPSH